MIAFQAAHAATKRAIAEQLEIKHPSAHKTYAELFKLCLKGYYGQEKAKLYVPKPAPQWAILGGTNG